MLMISGDVMKRQVIVKQQHRYTKERNILFNGVADCRVDDRLLVIEYLEDNTKADVHIEADDVGLMIYRHGEVETRLRFQKGITMQGEVMSEFGSFYLDLYTHNYIKRDTVIAVDYDVISNDEVSDGYYIIWTIKEGFA